MGNIAFAARYRWLISLQGGCKGGERRAAHAHPMQPVDFLFLSDGRLFIRHASGEIVEAEPSDRGHAASLMLVLDEIATVDPALGLEVVPPVQN